MARKRSHWEVADALREVAGALEKAVEDGCRSNRLRAEDLVEAMLAVADKLDPPLSDNSVVGCVCPGCGERNADRLVWQDDDTVMCTCGMSYLP